MSKIIIDSDYPYNKAIGTIDSHYNLACHPDLGFSEEQIKMIMTENASNLTPQKAINAIDSARRFVRYKENNSLPFPMK